MKPLPPLDPSSGISTTYEAVVGDYKAPEATVGDALAAFGPDTAASGNINLDLSTDEGRKNRGRLAEMLAPDLRRSGERGAKRNATIPTVTMKQPDGATRVVPEMVAARAEANGMRVVEKRRPTLKFYKGTWFRWLRGEWVLDV